jgi:amino acid adenylation domain-containing protein/non-ribosomal peptide synthase protein (TIGR01720 family)
MASVQAVAAEDGAEQRLAAYVVPRQAATVETLRAHLGRLLPDYMIPAYFVLLDELPLTINGKVNRRALPPPEAAQQAVAAGFIAPRSELEHRVAAAFAAGLGLDRVGIHDNFFVLGGDSIRSIQVLSRLRAAGLALDFSDIFNHPTVLGLAVQAAKRAGAALPDAHTGPFELVDAGVRAVLPADARAAYPLTRLQQGMLFETLEAGASRTYHDVMSYHLRAAWNRDAMQAALRTIAVRHEILRTSFVLDAAAEPLQVVHEQADIPLAVDDLAALTSDAQRQRIDAWAREEATHPLDLARAPLLRVQVHLRSADEFQFSLSFHHAILDGWSVATLLTELFACYARHLGHDVAPLPPPPAARFRDYVALERRVLADDAERAFWRDYVAGARPTLLPRQPVSRDSAEATRRVQAFDIPITDATSHRLEQRTAALGVPLRTLLLAAHVRALGVICGESEVVTGLVTNGRPEQQDGERVLGLFLGTLPLRCRSTATSWDALVRHVHEVQKDVEAHRRFPLVEIQRLAGGPLFEADFNFVHFHILEQAQRTHRELQVLGGRGFEETGFTLAVNFSLGVGSRSLSGSLDLDITAITAEQGAHYARIYARVIESLADAHAPALDLLDTDEHDALVAAGNGGAAWPPASLHELVGQQIARTPDAVAVTDGAQSLTFAGLDKRANQLAHLLLARGVTRDAAVGVATTASCDRVVAMLAVLRAGAAYVPLDLEQPRERCAAILAEGRVRIVIADAAAAQAEWPEKTAIVVLRPDLFTWQPTPPPAVPVHPDNLAYVIFTSGSTGRPKGVQITHRGIANHMAWMRRQYPLAPGDRVLQKTPASFDASVWEFWAPLVEGATLVLVPDGAHRDPAALARVMRGERISILQVVPTLLHALVDEPEFAGCTTLRRLFIGGEPFARELVARARAHHPALEVANLYGPTEVTIEAVVATLRPDHLVVAIGRPIDGMRAFVTDAVHEGLAPVLTDGDLYIGGAGLARGYAGRPGMTAASFVPDALSGEAGARLYATGDRARWVRATVGRPELDLEFRGRADDQVKLHGQRVELGEIEAALHAHPAVRDAAALLVEAAPGKRLVAHVVTSGGVGFDAALRAHLADRLPSALMPNAFVFHDALPRTSSGKIDRRALRAASDGTAAPRAAFVAPGSEVERALAAAYAEVLGLEQVGISEDFFTLGGDSILALQIVARLRKAGWRLSPRRILEYPTIARVAAHAEALAPRRPAHAPRAPAGRVPLAPIQQDFFARFDAIAQAGLATGRVAHWNQSMLLSLPAGIEPERVRDAVAAVAAAHDATRLRFRQTSAGWEQHYVALDAPGGIVFETIDLSADANWQAALEARAEQAQASLDLEAGPVGRAVQFRLGDGSARLLLVLHHLVVDLVSWQILLGDLAAALRAHGKAVLPPQSASYADWVAALAARADVADAAPWLALAAQARATAPVRITAQRDASDNLVKDAVKVRTRLDTVATAALLRDAPARLRARPEELLLTALFDALTAADAASSLWLELEGHGREELSADNAIDVSRTVGWFTALYPVCLQRAAGTKGSELLRAVKRDLRPLSARGLDFGALRYLAADPAIRKELASLPRPEVAFNFLGRVDAGLADTGAASSGITAAEEPAGHDHDPAGQRHFVLEIIARISADALIVDWIYPGEAFARATIEAYASDMLRSLRDLLAGDATAAASASDFPLAQLADGEAGSVIAAHPDLETILPPSPMQEGLLFHALDDEQPGVYVQQITAVLEGAVDRQALGAAWSATLRRHDALRMTFHRREADGRAYSVVHRDVACPIMWHDWSALGEIEAAQRWQHLLREDRARGFVLADAPLMRLHVARLADGRWRLLWSHHHLLLDGWSLPLVLGDVIAHYRAIRQGVAPALTPAGSYADYLAWRSGRSSLAAEPYWRDVLRGFDTPNLLALPPPDDMLARDEGSSDEVGFTLSVEMTRALSELARANRVTLATVVQCWWAYLVARFSGRRDVLFGLTVAGRPAELRGIASTVGLFINTLPLRVHVPAGCSLLGLAAAVDAASAALVAHEDSRLVDVQRLADTSPGTPLFDTILVFENYPLGAALADDPLADFKVRDVGAIERTHYPLACFVMPGERLSVRLVYDGTRFARAGVERLAAFGRGALRAMADTPSQPLDALSMLPPQEREGLVLAARNASSDGEWLPVHRRVARVAARAPDRTAVVCGTTTLSYGALAARAGRLARTLRRNGLGPEDLVGIYLDRSADMLVALLGVLEAGAAYVPLDPRFPQARLELMLAHSRARALVTHGDLAAQLPEPVRSGLLLIDLDDPADVAGDPLPHVAVHPDNLAYVIFTSGSTGTPKGVQVPHGALANVIESFAAQPGLGADDTLVAVTTLSFDIAALELLLPLTVGARLIVASAEEALDGSELAQLVAREHATVMQATPASWQMLLAAGWEGAKDLSIWSGGEALPTDLAVQLLTRGRALWNLYGPTETTIWSTVGKVAAARSASVLGWPVAATSTYVADQVLELAPPYVPGELLIGGKGLARGYRGQPGLTAERFVPDAFSVVAGARAYRTGDEVRWTAGELAFLGRLDQQVKIRGFRVELGEIEVALRAMPAVASAVVVSRTDRAGLPRLAAYVVRAGGTDGDLREQLQRHLGQLLPAYMLPSAYVFLDALPLTPNGKVDRRALPLPEDAAARREIVAPRGAIEQAIAGIWQDILGVQDIGIHDSFFELGGHSLTAASLLSTLRQAFSAKLAMRALFEGPTIAQLAQTIVALEARPGRAEQIARALLRIRGMSAEEKALLRAQQQARGKETRERRAAEAS